MAGHVLIVSVKYCNYTELCLGDYILECRMFCFIVYNYV